MGRARWVLNTIGNTASMTDSSELAWVEGNNNTGKYEVVHETSLGQSVILEAETEQEAREGLARFCEEQNG